MPKRIPTLDTRPHRTSSPSARQKPTRQERGYGKTWQRTRAAFLAAHPLCQDCDDNGLTVEATEVDHIDGKGPNGPRGHDDTNLRALCKSCHAKKTVRCDGGLGHHPRQG